jgi:hypothetical protein
LAIRAAKYSLSNNEKMYTYASDSSSAAKAAAAASPPKPAVSSGLSYSGDAHPIVMSACWYLDFNWDVDKYLNTDMIEELIKQVSAEPLTPSPSSPSAYSAAKETTIPAHGSSHMDQRSYSGPGAILGGEASMWTEKVSLLRQYRSSFFAYFIDKKDKKS